MKKFSVSGRFIDIYTKDIIKSVNDRFLRFNTFGIIESVFGCYIGQSILYGGRYNANILNRKHIDLIYKMGWAVSITFSNLYFDGKLDNYSEEILDVLHVNGNSVVVANDELAKLIRKRYPKFILRASATKLITTIKEVNRLLDLYDLVVLMPNYSTNYVFLESIVQKDRIVLFANANCAYRCKNHVCYDNISKRTRSESTSAGRCTFNTTNKSIGTTYFDLELLNEFTNFKIVNDVLIK